MAALEHIDELAELIQALRSPAPLDEVLQRLAAATCQLVDADRSLIVCDVDGITHRGSADDANRSLLGHDVAELRRLEKLCAVVQGEGRSMRMTAPQLRALGVQIIRDWLAVPVCSSSGTPLGALQLCDSRRDGGFDDGDERLLVRLVAPVVALAIEDASLRSRLERTRRSCEALVGGLAHDLKDPIQSIRSCATLLARPMPEDKQTFARAAIDRGIEKLGQRIADWTAMTMIDSDLLQLQPTTNDVRVLLGQVSEATSTPMRWQVDNEGALVAADRDSLALLFRNLVAFAAEHAPDQGVSVDVRRVDGEVHFAVAGLGPALEATFARTEQPHRRGRQVQLSIVKGIVAAHHSRSWIDDNGDGGRLCFTLPAAPQRGETEAGGSSIS